MTVLGIDARAAAEEPAGRGRYVRELLRALRDLGGDERYELWCREPWEDLGERFSYRVVGAPDPWWHLLVAARCRNDAYLSTNSYLTAWGLRVPTAVAVMDMITFVHPGWAQARARRIERATLGFATRRADAFLCISEATREDLLARHPEVADRARAIPLAASPGFTPDGPRAEGSYVLAAGTLEPRKNLERLIGAWSAAGGDTELVIVGPTGWEMDGILARAARPGVRMTGFVDEDELAALYRGATVFAYPSLYEGFGLPVLEAMACGAPVLTSIVSSLPEVAGDAAELVDPLDTGDIARALGELLASPQRREELGRRGVERARAFSWERTARETRDVLLQLASTRS